MTVVAKLVEEGEIARGIEAFSRRSVAHGGDEWTSENVRPGVGLRLYRATADSHSILAKDGPPDHRIPIPLTRHRPAQPSAVILSSANASASRGAVQRALRPLGLGRTQSLVPETASSCGPTVACEWPNAMR
jgi:hypothetical protein